MLNPAQSVNQSTDNPALLNMPNTPKAEISAFPSRAYLHMAYIGTGELRVN